jgi:chromosomal replication initiation ATPase DnaA
MTGTIWDTVLARIETKVNRFSYHSWFSQTALLQDTGSTITIRVADPMVVDWLTKHYAGVIGEALAEAGRK